VADNMTTAQRSATMSRIRSRDTKPELCIRRLVHARGLRFRTHAKWLPGTPDLAFSRAKVAVFVDGDFWHGWKFEEWREGLAPYWLAKIERNMERDQLNVEALRTMGWTIIRLWEHEVRADAERCVDRIERAVRGSHAAAIPDARSGLSAVAEPRRAVAQQ
jgi:DNA mismatch endonuclease, patch repair protein